jgi:Zn-dependent peptidase ImmA (M78 family)
MVVKNARRAAYKLLRHYGLSMPTLDDLVIVVEDQGFEIVDFSNSRLDSDFSDLVQGLAIHELVKTRKAFVYQNGDVKLLFLCETLTSEEKRYAIAHELGHIQSGHLRNGANSNSNVAEEYEANEFAHYLLNPGLGIRGISTVRRRKALFTILAVVIIALLLGTWVTKRKTTKETSYYKEFYVTESGKKYHEKECSAIRDKANVHRLTMEEYESGLYEPCNICKPESEN